MADVSGALAAWDEEVQRIGFNAIYATAAATQDDAPRGKSGELAASLDPGTSVTIASSAAYQFEGEIRTDVEYASFTDTGTAAHLIQGNPLLAFEWPNGPNGAGLYFFRSVNHPGSPGTAWFEAPMSDRWDNFLADAL